MNIMNSLRYTGMRKRLCESRLINLRMNLIIISKDWTSFARVRDSQDHREGHLWGKVLRTKAVHMCHLTDEMDLVVVKLETPQTGLLLKDLHLEQELVSILILLLIEDQVLYPNLQLDQ